MQEAGLNHLMEAATALATLTDTSNGPSSPVVASPQPETTPEPKSQQAEGNIITKQKLQQSTSTAHNNKEIFPVRLMAILNDSTITDIITWLPHGRSFVIVRPDVFTEEVLPKYLPPVDSRTSTKYPSFTRKLNRWGFRQATRGPDTGAFHHSLFCRDNPTLCLEMVCQRSRDRTKGNNNKLPAKKRKVVTQLTEASLEAMNKELMAPPTASIQQQHHQQQQQQTIDQDKGSRAAIATVSVSGESSSSEQSDSRVRQGITADTELAQRALSQLNEQERLRTAKAMLFNAYCEAVQQQSQGC